jgi:hypothetical protein
LHRGRGRAAGHLADRQSASGGERPTADGASQTAVERRRDVFDTDLATGKTTRRPAWVHNRLTKSTLPYLVDDERGLAGARVLLGHQAPAYLLRSPKIKAQIEKLALQ